MTPTNEDWWEMEAVPTWFVVLAIMLLAPYWTVQDWWRDLTTCRECKQRRGKKGRHDA